MIIFPIVYLAALALSLFNSGAGHGWGTGAMVILSLPLGSLSLVLEWLFPNAGLILLIPLFGFLQYMLIGYFVGSRLDRRTIAR